MIDAQLMVEAVTDASKRGEEAFHAWTATQMAAMRALYRSLYEGPSAGGIASGLEGIAPASDTAPDRRAPVDGEDISTVLAASALLDEGTPSAEGAQHAGGSEALGSVAAVDEPMTLSQLAAYHVGDVLRQAGMRTPGV